MNAGALCAPGTAVGRIARFAPRFRQSGACKSMPHASDPYGNCRMGGRIADVLTEGGTIWPFGAVRYSMKLS